MEQESPLTHPPVIVLVGPTASGKTSLAVELAKHLDAEVVSADSRQVYRYMDIGTATPTSTEMDGIVHRGFDVVDPDHEYSAGRFAADARSWIQEIQSRGKQVIIAGGSGLYLQALIDGFSVGEMKDDEIRESLEKRLERDGLQSLSTELEKVDPEYHKKILPADQQRILRALEVYYISGKPFSDHHAHERNSANFDTLWFGIKWSRNTLYDRINRRVFEMLERGLLHEVQELIDRGYENTNAMKSVGYIEPLEYFRELLSLEEMIDRIQKNTRHYAKRQLTWFRRNNRIAWIDLETNSLEELVSLVLRRGD
ncbi:tRNA (adenosine(37)-N6)-dimethylallyltransferase MiaA [bacterium]|nr:tRNA (adenosine(37)-N6)-dimethylallyltransferase MiaA [bacterium]